MSGDIPRDERPRCDTCGDLGALVERYEVRDKDGYEYTAMRDKPCGGCNGSGRK